MSPLLGGILVSVLSAIPIQSYAHSFDSNSCRSKISALDLLPKARDFEKPISSEALLGVLNAIGSEGLSIFMFFKDSPMEVAVPLTVLDLAQNAMMVVPSKFWTNYNLRLIRIHSSLAYVRQLALGLFFSTNFTIVANWNHLADLDVAKAAGGIVAASLLNMPWRTTTNASVDTWYADKENPIDDVSARRNIKQIFLFPFGFLGSPLYALSFLPHQEVLLSTPAIDFNIWHFGMMGMAAIGGVFWKFPHLFNPTSRWIHKNFKFLKGEGL